MWEPVARIEAALDALSGRHPAPRRKFRRNRDQEARPWASASEAVIARIRELNDAFRRDGGGDHFLLEDGVWQRSYEDRRAIIETVATFDAFSPQDGHHGEHDFGAFAYKGQRFVWQIDYYQKGSRFDDLAEDPSNQETTDRILSVALVAE
jgi:hypothetical protein